MAAESDVRKMPTVVMTGLPHSIAKKGPLQKKEASLLTFSITSLIKVLVSLSKFTERQLVVIKTRNKPGKKTSCAHHTQPSFRLCKRTWVPRTGSQFLPGLQVSKGEQRTIDLHISSVHRHGSYNFRQTNFKDFSSLFQRQITVSRTKIYEINQHSLTLFWTHYWLKHIMESFTTLTSSAMVDHIILYYFSHKTLQNDRLKKLLRMSRLTSYEWADVRKNTETRVLWYEGPPASPSSKLW